MLIKLKYFISIYFLFVEIGNVQCKNLIQYCKNGNEETLPYCEDGVFKWHPDKVNELHVGGIFPMIGSWPGGQSCLPSAIMALNEINLNTRILPNYKLTLTWYNSEVSKP